ncbi:MAG: phosphate/phosphite/phosphonate ABC transporter substrate-binding protein [Nitrospirae bacterium]|nr:phosphate/phosphite/phosphonate ABC transporter substrate-binding protein [Nitrospirota bacterium]
MKIMAAFFMAILFAGVCDAAELHIGLIPEQNVFKQVKRYTPVGDYLHKKTGMKINFVILPRYGNILESFNEKKLDGAFWGSFTGALAITQLGVEPIARPVNPDGNSTYKGYIFVRKDSGIRNIAGMKGKSLAFVEKATTAGYMFPMAWFKKHGITDLGRYFREHYFAGSHDAAITAVLDRQVDIGCAKNTIFDMLAQSDPRIKSELMVIAESSPVPSNGLGLRKGISTDVKESIRKALLGMADDPDGREILREFRALRFISTSKEDYAPVFDMASDAGIDIKQYRYLNK